MGYEDELVERCADAVMDFLIAYGPQRWGAIRREVLKAQEAELEPAYKGALIDSAIENRVRDKLMRERRADHIELWYAEPGMALREAVRFPPAETLSALTSQSGSGTA